MNFNHFSKDPQTTADSLKGWFIERTVLATAKIAEASGQVYYRQTAFKYIEENAYYALLDTINETVKETTDALDINMGSNKNGNLTGWAETVFRTNVTVGIINFAKKALEYSVK